MMTELATAMQESQAPVPRQDSSAHWELEERELDLVSKARSLAAYRATYAGSFIYHEGVAWAREYFSPWYPIATVVERLDISIQAQLQRGYEVDRSGGIDYDITTPTVTLNARYQHLPTECVSDAHPLYEFDDTGVARFRDPFEPGRDPFRLISAKDDWMADDGLERAEYLIELITDSDPSTGVMGPGFPFA
jgi:hypothetical protein